MAQGLLLVLVAPVEIFGPRWPASVAPSLLLAGLVVIGLGVVLLLAGTLALGRSLTAFPRPRHAAALNEGGVYRLVRHPIYGGVILVVAGWSLAATPLGLAMTALVAAFLELKARREEAWLLAMHAGYDAYRRRVRWKFLPGLH